MNNHMAYRTPAELWFIRLAVAVLTLIAVLLGVPLSAQNPTQEIDETLSRLQGSWRVSYQDKHLGEVKGHVLVHRYAKGYRTIVRYSVIDPRTGQTHELQHMDTRMVTGAIELVFAGVSPSGAYTPDGGALPAGAVNVPVAVRGQMSATLDGTSTAQLSVKAGEPIRGTVHVRLPFKAGTQAVDRLDGRWQAFPGTAAFRGVRTGMRVQRGAASDEMQGTEVWTRGGPLITRVTMVDTPKVTILPQNRAGVLSRKRLSTVWLRVEGSGLPISSAVPLEVTFADPAITYTGLRQADPKVPGALQIQVDVSPRIVPGPKPLTLNGAAGSFTFDFAGWDALPRHVRKLRDDQYEPAPTLNLGEKYQVEIEFAVEPLYSERLVATVTSAPNAEPVAFVVRKTRDRPTVFRSEPFLLLGPGDAGPTADSEAAKLRIVRAQVGDSINSATIDATPKYMGTAVVIDYGKGASRYDRALARARTLRKNYPDAERYQVSNFIITELGYKTIEITTADHAVMLLLLEDLENQMADVVKKGKTRKPDSPDSRKDREALVKALVDAARASLDEDPPHLITEVPGPEGGNVRLKDALSFAVEQAMPGATAAEQRKRFLEYATRSVAAAERTMQEQAKAALASLNKIDITRPNAELLAAAKTAFPALGLPLAQSLVRPADVANGEPAYPKIVPDMAGRSAVTHFDGLFTAIQGQAAYAAFDRFYMAIVTAPLFFLGGGGLQVAGLAAKATAALPGAAVAGISSAVGIAQVTVVATKAVQLGSDLFTAKAASDATDIAQGTVEVTGTNAYWAAHGEMTAATFSAAMNAVDLVGVPLFMKAVQYGARPSQAALRTAVYEAGRRGVKDLARTPGMKQLFEYARGSAEYKALFKGAGALDDFDKEVLRTAYPKGIPPALAKRIGLPANDPKLPVDQSNINTQPLPSAETMTLPPQQLTPAQEALAFPEPVQWGVDNPALGGVSPAELGRMNNAARAALKRGATDEAFRIKFEQNSLAGFRNPTATEERRALAGWRSFQQLRKTNPAAGQLDEIDFLDGLLLNNRRAGSTLPVSQTVDAEEALALTLIGKGVNVTPEELARVTGASKLNAEAAILNAKKFHGVGTPRPSTSATPAGAAPPAGNATSGSNSGPATAMELNSPRQKAIKAELEKYGIADELNAVSEFHAAQKLSPRATVAGRLRITDGVSSADVMARMGITREELRGLLDDYVRLTRFESDPAARAAAVEKLLNNPPATPGNIPPTRPVGPGGGSGSPPPPPAPVSNPLVVNKTHRTVEQVLDRMGMLPARAQELPIAEALKAAGQDPVVAAAGLAKAADVPPQQAAQALGVDMNRYAALLDQYEAAVLPLQPAGSRAREIGRYLEKYGVDRGIDRVNAGRQARAKAALDELGVPNGAAKLIDDELDVESAVVGRAYDEGVRALLLMERRNLDLAKLRFHLNDYLRYGRGITDNTRRKAMVDQYLAGR
jgi:hypothetical protein